MRACLRGLLEDASNHVVCTSTTRTCTALGSLCKILRSSALPGLQMALRAPSTAGSAFSFHISTARRLSKCCMRARTCPCRCSAAVGVPDQTHETMHAPATEPESCMQQHTHLQADDGRLQAVHGDS
jgi:hypothetical protein